MKTIWKYELEITDEQDIEIPCSAEILTAQMQKEKICLWCLVDTKNAITKRKIRIYGTGHNVDDNGTYIRTCQMADGLLVWHIFDMGEEEDDAYNI